MTASFDIPAGFEKLPEGLGFTDAIQPLYRLIDGEELRLGLRVGPQHTNMMGICHGGVLMTLADVAAASALNHVRGEVGGSPTINLSLDFISAGKEGDWLEAVSEGVTVKRRFGFSHGLVCVGDRVVARFNGTFYLPDHDGMFQAGREPGDLEKISPG